MALRRWGLGPVGCLRAAAALTPMRPAIIERRGVISYKALLGQCDSVAVQLNGLSHRGRLGVLCGQGREAVVALVSALTVGADAVLLDTRLPDLQLRELMSTQNIGVVLHDAESIRPDLMKSDDTLWMDVTKLVPLSSPPPPPPIRRGQIIVLTAGTTGLPKGAIRPARMSLAAFASPLSRLPLRAGDRVAIATPLCHTWGHSALHACLALRATIVLPPYHPADLLDTLVSHRCTALVTVPVTLLRLLEIPAATTDLRVVAVGGSALPVGLPAAFMDAYGDILYNVYGSSEASCISIATPRDLRRAPTTAGRSLPGTQVAVLGQDGIPVAPGEIGEIFAATGMPFSGYTTGQHGRLTQSSLLATGDLGHFAQDGTLHVDGRKDDMIISGGQNIYPAPVVRLIEALPQVREVAVIGVPDKIYGQSFRAYVALRPGQVLDADTVSSFHRDGTGQCACSLKLAVTHAKCHEAGKRS
ncbi:AMP-binding protein, partial [Nonomuraea sp. NPDC050786]|uniref:AMP-binding protein n=1 Tax=Nonomuraea sp. NPDC050786 TaxID=3154840 RepID=UPI0033EDE989